MDVLLLDGEDDDGLVEVIIDIDNAHGKVSMETTTIAHLTVGLRS